MPADPHHAYHEHLLGRMADVLGINLDLDLDLTRISRAELLRAITRCGQCPDPAGCATWLERHQAGAAEPPHLCRNRTLLERLRKEP